MKDNILPKERKTPLGGPKKEKVSFIQLLEYQDQNPSSGLPRFHFKGSSDSLDIVYQSVLEHIGRALFGVFPAAIIPNGDNLGS